MTLKATIRLARSTERSIRTLERSDSSADGFSLLEALIALAISAIAASILMFALRQALVFGNRAAANSYQTFSSELLVEILRAQFQAVLPAYPDQGSSVSGSDVQVKFLTPVSPAGDFVAPVDIELKIDADSQEGMVVLSESYRGEVYTLLKLVGERGVISYLDETSNWREQWPPGAVSGDVGGVLPPAVVRIRVVDDGTPTDFLFALGGREAAPIRLQEMLEGIGVDINGTR